MIDNGFLIKTGNIFDTVNELRLRLKSVQRELVLGKLAQNIELMQDMSFTLGAKFEKSIYETAKDFVQGRIDGVRNGAFADSEYDFRSSLSFCPHKELGENTYLVLFNCVNKELISAFEQSSDTIEPFKYNELCSDEENIRRGTVWQAVFEKADWNAAAIGCSAQLTFQPNLDDIIGEDGTSELKSRYRKPEERKYGFIRNHIIKEYVSRLIGRSNIADVSPVVLTDFFVRAVEYSDSEDGQNDIKVLEKTWEKAFQPVSDNIILS